MTYKTNRCLVVRTGCTKDLRGWFWHWDYFWHVSTFCVLSYRRLFGGFLGLSCNNYFLSWAHSIARAAGPRAHLCREPGSVGPSAGPYRGWRCLAAGTGTREEPAPGQCWRKASKDIGEVWEAWLQERWRGTGGGASELGLAPHGAGCWPMHGVGRGWEKGGIWE